MTVEGFISVKEKSVTFSSYISPADIVSEHKENSMGEYFKKETCVLFFSLLIIAIIVSRGFDIENPRLDFVGNRT